MPEKSGDFLSAEKCPEGSGSPGGPTNDRLLVFTNHDFSLPYTYPEDFCTVTFYCQFSQSMCLIQNEVMDIEKQLILSSCPKSLLSIGNNYLFNCLFILIIYQALYRYFV